MVWHMTAPIDLSQPPAARIEAIFSTARVATCNSTWAAILGHADPATLIGRRLDQVLVTDDTRNRVVFEQLFCEAGSVVGAVTHVRRADGTDRYCLDNVRAEITNGRLTAIHVAARDITPLVAAETQLARSEHQLREALTAARVGTWRWDIRADTIEWSSSCYDVFGIMPGSFGGTITAFEALVHPYDRDRVMRNVQDAIDGHTEHYVDEFRVLMDDGSERWLEGRGRLEHDGPDRPLLTGTVANVTTRKQTERALRNSEIRFANLASAAFECIAVTTQGKLRDVNDRFVETFGWKREELIGKPVVELVHPDDRAMVAMRMRHGWQDRYEHRAVRKDGSVIIVEVQARSLPFDGDDGRVTSLRDVTTQRQNEARLVRIAESVSASIGEAFFRSLVANLAVVLQADHVMIADTCLHPPLAETLAAFSQGRIVANYRYDPGDGPCAETIRTEICVLRDGVRARFPKDPRVAEFAAEGYVGAALRDPQGRLLGLLAVLFRRPVAEPTLVASTLAIFAARAAAELARRHVEAELRDSETRLRATIDSTPNVAVQWYDAAGRVQFWNRASETMFGWTAAEAVGRTLDQLIHTPAEAQAFVAVLQRIGASGETLGPVECDFRRKDGSKGVCLSTQFRIPSGSGQSIFVCMDVDVTARKRAEQRREELAHHLMVAQEAERRRLASELHDSLGQSLSLIKNRAHLARGQHGAVNNELDAIERLVSSSLAEVRSLVHNLRPLHVEQSGLTAALQALVDETASSTAIEFEQRFENVDDVVRGDAATHVYRIAQEALHNLAEHSRSRTGKVELERDVHCVRLRVGDTGVGFSPADVGGGGLGLESMTERARMLGGELTIDSRPGAGTTIRLELPIRESLVPAADEDHGAGIQETPP